VTQRAPTREAISARIVAALEAEHVGKLEIPACFSSREAMVLWASENARRRMHEVVKVTLDACLQEGADPDLILQLRANFAVAVDAIVAKTAREKVAS